MALAYERQSSTVMLGHQVPEVIRSACSGWKGVAAGLRRPVKRVNHCVSADAKERFDRVGFVVLECAVPVLELEAYARVREEKAEGGDSAAFFGGDI